MKIAPIKMGTVRLQKAFLQFFSYTHRPAYSDIFHDCQLANPASSILRHTSRALTDCHRQSQVFEGHTSESLGRPGNRLKAQAEAVPVPLPFTSSVHLRQQAKLIKK